MGWDGAVAFFFRGDDSVLQPLYPSPPSSGDLPPVDSFRFMSSSPAVVLRTDAHGVDPLTYAQVPHIKVDFVSCRWSYENCTKTKDHPFTVRTTQLGAPCYMHATIKLLPAQYIFTIKGFGNRPNCRLEILQRARQTESARSQASVHPKIVRRHGCVCGRQPTDITMLIYRDTDAEVRIGFDPQQDLRVPTFAVMEVRSRQRIAHPLKQHVPCGLYKPTPVTYTALDIHRLLKRANAVVDWLRQLDEHLNEVLRMITNPLWDVDDAGSAFEYAQAMQAIQNAISIDIPRSFIASSFCFSMFLFPGVRVPLISQTLVNKLGACIQQRTMRTDAIVAVFDHSLKYINFMVIEYLEFIKRISDRLSSIKDDTAQMWNVVQIAT